jgi:hypothetical protein
MKTLALTLFLFLSTSTVLGALDPQPLITMPDRVYFACVSRSHFIKLHNVLAVDGDAFFKEIQQSLKAKTCTMLRKGDQLFITNMSSEMDIIQIRRKGQFVEYWTHIAIVE